jgi:hypothetical protein
MYTLYFSVNLSSYFNSASSLMNLQSVDICVSEYRFMQLLLFLSRSIGCVSGGAGGCGKGLRCEKTQGQKILINRAEFPPSVASIVGQASDVNRYL